MTAKNSQKDSLVLGKRIGEGATAKVHLAQLASTQVCAKVINSSYYVSATGRKFIDNEVAVMRSLNHTNVLKMVDYRDHEGQKVIVTELCEGGDLYHRIKKVNSRQGKENSTSKALKGSKPTPTGIPVQEVMQIMLAVLEGYLYLESKDIVHRDIKPENILFSGTTPKIADFGFAAIKTDTALLKTNAGSPLYMSPQALESNSFSNSSDIFALGVIWYQMLVGCTPWRATSEKQLMTKIRTQKPSISLGMPRIESLILRCLSANASTRPKTQQIIEQLKAAIEPACGNVERILIRDECSSNKQLESTARTRSSQVQPFGQIQNLPKVQKTNASEIIIPARHRSLTVGSNSKVMTENSCQNISAVGNISSNHKKSQFAGKIETQSKLVANKQQKPSYLTLKLAALKYLPSSYPPKIEYMMSQIWSFNPLCQEARCPLPSGLSKDPVCSKVSSLKTEGQICKESVEFFRHLLKLAEYHGAKQVSEFKQLYEHVSIRAKDIRV